MNSDRTEIKSSAKGEGKTDKFNHDKDTWKVINSYLTQCNNRLLIRHHLDSYDDFMDKKIEAIVKQFNPLSIYNDYDVDNNNYRSEINIEFGNTYFSSPLIHENNGSTKLMYPSDARLRNLTYSAPICIDIKISLIDDPFNKKELVSTKTIKKVNIGKIPIMIKSKYCLLNNNTSCR